MNATAITLLDHSGSCDTCRAEKGTGYVERQYLVTLVSGQRLTLCPAHAAKVELA